jgi:uncharacterized membrane protein HdeD (DUF308 family)
MTFFGIIVLILGLLAIACPLAAGATVSTMVAILLVAAGVVRMLWAFKAGSFGKGALALLLGGLTLGVGVVMLARPLVVLASLALILAVYFLLDGISEIAAAFSVKPAKGWGWMAFGGAMSIVLSVLIWSQWPLSGAWAIGILVGIRLVFAGTAMIALGSAIGTVRDAVAAESQ